MDEEVRRIRIGALRYKDGSGHWQVANPGDALYSTVTMLATQYLTLDGWRLIETGELYVESESKSES